MPKTIFDTGNPDMKAGEYDNIPDGAYTAIGIEDVFSRDAENNIIQVPQNGEPVLRFRLKVLGAERGPAVSASLPQFYAWVAALGGPVTANSRNRHQHAVIERHYKDVAWKNRVPITVENGWAKGSPVRLPTGHYTVKFVEAFRPDYDPSPFFQECTSKFGGKLQRVYVFEVLDDTIWKGFRFREYVESPFISEFKGADGVTVTSRQLGTPIFTNQGGGIPMVVRNWKIMIDYFAPGVDSYEWKATEAESDTGYSETEEPQIIIERFMKEASERDWKVKIYYSMVGKMQSNRVLWEHIPALNEGLLQVMEQNDEEEVSTPAAVEDAHTTAVALFKIFVSEQYEGKDYIKADSEKIIFTDVGRAEFAIPVVSPAWEALGYGVIQPIHSRTTEEITALVDKIKEGISPSF